MVGKNSPEIVSIKISAELESLEHVKKLFKKLEKESTIQVCDGNAELKLLAAGDTLSFSGGAEIELLLSFSVGVASGIVGNMIYSAICHGAKKLELNGRRTRLTEENITQAIETIKELVQLSEEKDSSSEDIDENSDGEKV